VGVCFTEAEAKALAAQATVKDGPDDTGAPPPPPPPLRLAASQPPSPARPPAASPGEMFERPGKLSDPLPRPYENEAQARMANSGALPPDLSLIVKARHDGENYLFALLTGYTSPPAGVTVAAGQHYNPYFPGGKISMGKQLEDGGVEFDDGTPASASQMAKDVTTFLSWASEPKQDTRKRMGQEFFVFVLIAALASGWYKRLRFMPFKAKKISYYKPPSE
jgi:ubiquinol-cytochrome c reductase cytochrome c1 subunit